MSIFSFLRGPDINDEIGMIKDIPGAILLDVRSKEEFSTGHIPRAVNVPLDSISSVERIIRDHDTPVFVYCLRGTRSRSAVSAMKGLGYTNVKSIGGIASYKGKTEI